MSLLPQFGFVELLVVAIVALIVVGPKELPALMKSCGQMLAKARRMAGEFTMAFEQMAREAEVDELRKEMEALKHENAITQLKQEVDDAVAPIKQEIEETSQSGETFSAATMNVKEDTGPLDSPLAKSEQDQTA